MLKFANEKHAPREIKKLLANADDPFIAVAFWGAGAIETLGIKQSHSKKLRIVCNLFSGACNPEEIAKLMVLADLRTNDRLHAKIYWTPDGVVVGSSNASTNGLVVEGSEIKGWHEGNLITDAPDVIATTKQWFESLWEDSKSVGKADLAHAQVLWDARSKLRPPKSGSVRGSLFSAYREAKDDPRWRRVKLVVYTSGLDDDGKRQLGAYKKGELTTEGVSSDRIKGAWGYQGWEDEAIAADDWLIDVDARREGAAKVHGIAEVGSRVIKLCERGGEPLHIAFRSKRVALPGLGSFSLTPAEKDLICGSVEGLLRPRGKKGDRHSVIISLPEAIRKIDRLA